ncbi:hypothetical protein NDU88_000717 [Pleurodeles waltl]|uniref:Uncharacterized protein n=1 Tax=Pleurodeles waltl TaxID=8319 RepID=A0AAV7VUX6_PLEWA|nr:hypothetical protein NDU88_000717 [Pleurodeles waltl]
MDLRNGFIINGSVHSCVFVNGTVFGEIVNRAVGDDGAVVGMLKAGDDVIYANPVNGVAVDGGFTDRYYFLSELTKCWQYGLSTNWQEFWRKNTPYEQMITQSGDQNNIDCERDGTDDSVAETSMADGSGVPVNETKKKCVTAPE